MALFTGGLLLDMPDMIEDHMFGQIIGLSPWCRGLVVEIPVFLFYPRMIGNDILMTVKAFLHRRNPRMFGPVHVGMTVFAMDLLNACVNAMAERNGLLRSYVRGRRNVKEIQKQERKKDTEHGQ
jgi:hypothetical protein